MEKIQIDKELLRLQLESEGYDISQIDMDLAVRYEEAKLAVVHILGQKVRVPPL